MAEINAAYAELSYGGSDFYLRGASVWLAWVPESMTNGDYALLSGNNALAIWNYNDAQSKAAAARRWISSSVRFASAR